MDKQKVIDLTNKAETLIVQLQTTLIELQLELNPSSDAVRTYYQGMLAGATSKVEQARLHIVSLGNW